MRLRSRRVEVEMSPVMTANVEPAAALTIYTIKWPTNLFASASRTKEMIIRHERMYTCVELEVGVGIFRGSGIQK